MLSRGDEVAPNYPGGKLATNYKKHMKLHLQEHINTSSKTQLSQMKNEYEHQEQRQVITNS
jgi:hypothetical protein